MSSRVLHEFYDLWRVESPGTRALYGYVIHLDTAPHAQFLSIAFDGCSRRLDGIDDAIAWLDEHWLIEHQPEDWHTR